MLNLSIRPLEPGSPLLVRIATEPFAHWGPLTGHGSRKAYEAFLDAAGRSMSLPRVLIPEIEGTLLGSVNLVANEMMIRPQFTPWMGQLFVASLPRGWCRTPGVSHVLCPRSRISPALPVHIRNPARLLQKQGLDRSRRGQLPRQAQDCHAVRNYRPSLGRPATTPPVTDRNEI
jgi:hypothetical protein